MLPPFWQYRACPALLLRRLIHTTCQVGVLKGWSQRQTEPVPLQRGLKQHPTLFWQQHVARATFLCWFWGICCFARAAFLIKFVTSLQAVPIVKAGIEPVHPSGQNHWTDRVAWCASPLRIIKPLQKLFAVYGCKYSKCLDAILIWGTLQCTIKIVLVGKNNTSGHIHPYGYIQIVSSLNFWCFLRHNPPEGYAMAAEAGCVVENDQCCYVGITMSARRTAWNLWLCMALKQGQISASQTSGCTASCSLRATKLQR